MSLSFNSELVYFAALGLGLLATFIFLKLSWRYYGLLLFVSGAVGIGLCYLFVKFGFYSFHNIPLHNFSVPYIAMMLTFPVGVMFGVRYSPLKWVWKIPFYWGIVHLGVLFELLIKEDTKLFRFNYEWDLWDSYTWWWIYFLLFEWIGGKIVPSHLRKPIDGESFRYGRWGWIIFHLIVITTIFLAGFYLGQLIK